MSIRKRHLFSGMLLIVVAGFSLVLAQQKPKELPKVKLSGSIKTVKPGLIEVKPSAVRIQFGKDAPKAKEDEKDPREIDHLVAVDPRKTKIQVFGKSDATYLRPGQQVRFTGYVDPKGAYVGELSQIDVLISDRRFEPKLKLEVPTVSFTKDLEAPKNRAFTAHAVVGGVRRGQMVVTVQNRQRLSVPLSQELEVRYTTNNYGVAKEGDSINVQGRLYESGKVIADSLSIVLQQPKEEPGEAPAKKDAEQPSDAKEKAP